MKRQSELYGNIKINIIDAVYFIGHDKEAKDNDGNITNIRPALSNSTREVVAGLADIYGYARQMGADKNSALILRDKTGFVECGCRFKYIPDYIELSYDNLVNALHEAIDKEAMEHGNKFVTNERIGAVQVSTYDYDAEMARFSSLANELMAKDQSNQGKITDTIERYLGRGNKVSETTRAQAEIIFLINQELEELK